MALNDVWRNLGQEIGIFYRGRWDHVPSAPGVYAWFYPLRLTSKNLEAFVREVQVALSFEASCEGFERMETRHSFAWLSQQVIVERARLPLSLSQEMRLRWDEVSADPRAFEAFRSALMKSTLLMPPLYVGKTNNLRKRCGQHRLGGSGNTFHSRFESFASRNSLSAREITDLILVTVSSSDEYADALLPMEDLLEEALKAIAAPPYSAT